MKKDRKFPPPIPKSLAQKTVVLLTSFSIVPMGVLASLYFFFYYEGQQHSIISLQKEIVHRLSVSISAYLEKTTEQIELFASLLDIETGDALALRASCYTLLNRVFEYDSLAIADSDGNEIAKVSRYYTFRPFELNNISQQRSFRSAINGKSHIGQVGISEFSKFPLIYITAPIYNSYSQISGVVVAGINISKMWAIISQYRLGEDRYAYVVDQKGYLIAYKDLSSVLEKKDVKSIEGVRNFLDKDYGVFEYQGLSRTPVIGANEIISLTNWGIIVEQPLKMAYRNLYILSAVFLGIFIVTATAASYFGFRFSYQNIIIPLRLFQKEAEVIAKGQFDHTIDIKSTDEIGQLADSFNRMAVNLKDTMVSRNILIREINEHRQTEKALRESEECYRMIFQYSPIGIMHFNQHGVIVDCNKKFADIIGAEKDRLIGFNMLASMPEGPAKWAVADAISKGQGQFEGDYHTVSGDKTITIKAHHRRIDSETGDFIMCIGVFEDISERRKLESQLRHAHKMEAIGTLAGGIAHDFNNLLMGIQGNVSLGMLQSTPNTPIYKKFENIEKAVQRGSELSKQILAFARGGKYELKPCNLNTVIKEHNYIFGRTRKEVTIHPAFAEDLWNVEVDQGQIEQVLMNIYINSWQAMPDGGKIYVTTQNVILDEEDVKSYDIRPGKYVKISITDTGIGMTPDVQQKIFEPFFTTKGFGGGTGLGLASAFGIIRSHEGMITVYSEKDVGATFNIYLKVTEKTPMIEPSDKTDAMVHGNGTILLVDDEEMVIDVAVGMLEKLGYKVITASSGEEALSVYTQHRNAVSLVILDLIMPNMSGEEVFDQLKRLNPDIKVLLSSGYSINGQVSKILNKGCSGFIQKPFNIKVLSQKIAEVLNFVVYR